MDIDKFSAIVVVGDDGSFHDVINGMLEREDGAKLPLAFIPSGEESDLCKSLGIKDVD